MSKAEAQQRAGVTLRCATGINGIRMEWADTAQSADERSRPVVLFLHGWPESWYSWRHQLLAVRAAGFRGIAPSMRGYGATEAPTDVASYNCYSLAADVLALLQHLGIGRAALVAHDHGANFGWKLCLLHPQVFTAYLAMSVPYGGRPGAPPLEMLRAKFGEPNDAQARFNYQLHHCMPGATQQYDGEHTRPALRAIFSELDPKGRFDGRDEGSSGGSGGRVAPPPVRSQRLWLDGVAEPMWRRLPQPAAPPSWLDAVDFEYFARSFERAGWHGGLRWYAVMDLDWHATPQLEGRKLAQPVAFVAGARDMVLRWFGGAEGTARALRGACATPPRVHILDGVGHWVQQEAPAAVNAILLDFLAAHRDRFARNLDERERTPPPGGSSAAVHARL